MYTKFTEEQNKIYKDYCEKFLKTQIRYFELNESFYFNFTDNEIKGLEHELYLKVEYTSKKKKDIKTIKNYMAITMKNKLHKILKKEKEHRKTEKIMEKAEQGNFISNEMKGQIAGYDDIPVFEIADTFNKKLSKKECHISLLLLKKHSIKDISRKLKMSVQYVKRISNSSENKLKLEFLLKE